MQTTASTTHQNNNTTNTKKKQNRNSLGKAEDSQTPSQKNKKTNLQHVIQCNACTHPPEYPKKKQTFSRHRATDQQHKQNKMHKKTKNNTACTLHTKQGCYQHAQAAAIMHTITVMAQVSKLFCCNLARITSFSSFYLTFCFSN